MNVTSSFNRYKESIRNLWNTYFYNNGTAGWDDHEFFEDIDKLLFEKLIITDILEIKEVKYDLALKLFRLKGTDNGLPIMINRTGDGGAWDHPITALIHDEYEIQYESYFDWDQLGIKDCRYIMSKILYSKMHPEIIGHKALIESQYVDILFVKP